MIEDRMKSAAVAVLEAALAEREKEPDSLFVSGVLPCPNCGKQLMWSAVGKELPELRINATCRTRGCIN